MAAKRVEVLVYEPMWALEFAAIRDRLQSALAGSIEGIEHVGSTSVPGLAAKPIIDIDVVIGESQGFGPIIAKLEELGYLHEGDKGITGRESFRYEG